VIIYAPEADGDVARLHTWYLKRSAPAAAGFMAKLALAEQRIRPRPRAYRLLRDNDIRRYSFKISRTSYLIDFREELGQIVILRVWRGRQHRPS